MPIPEAEAEALRRCLSILARYTSPDERANIAHRIEQRLSGDATRLAYSFRHLSVLFYPLDEGRAKALEATLQAARATNELASKIPADQGHVFLTDLAIWPACPPVPTESPLRYWLPGAPVEVPAPAVRKPMLPNATMVDAILKFRFPVGVKLAAAVSVSASKTGGAPSAWAIQQRQQADDERKRLTALTYSALCEEYELFLKAQADRQRAEAAAREAEQPFNQPSAVATDADFKHWARLDHWTLDEMLCLFVGREPSRVRVQEILSCKLISPFAHEFERLRQAALRSQVLGGGNHAIGRDEAVQWAATIGHDLPAGLTQALQRQREREPLPAHSGVPSAPVPEVVSVDALAIPVVTPGIDHVSWCDATLRADFWFQQTTVTPVQAAMLLKHVNPLDSDAAESAERDTTHDENRPLGPEHFKMLKLAFEDAANVDGQRTLAGWLSVAKQRRLTYHSWIDRYVAEVGGDTVPSPLGSTPNSDATTGKDPKERGREIKRKALIDDNLRRWPTIERDLKDASTNGLSEAARMASKPGWWYEGSALEWARARGKLREQAHGLGGLPSRTHLLQG